MNPTLCSCCEKLYFCSGFRLPSSHSLCRTLVYSLFSSCGIHWMWTFQQYHVIWVFLFYFFLQCGKTCQLLFMVQCFCLHIPVNILWLARHIVWTQSQSKHVQALFPELTASAFDPVSSAQLTRTGHHMRALGLGFSTGKKPGPQREVRKKKKNPWGKDTVCLSEAYQAMRVMCTVRPLRTGIKTKDAGRQGMGGWEIGEQWGCKKGLVSGGGVAE